MQEGCRLVIYIHKLLKILVNNNRDIILSKQSEFQNQIHQLFTRRCKENNKSISNELNSINAFTNKNFIN